MLASWIDSENSHLGMLSMQCPNRPPPPAYARDLVGYGRITPGSVVCSPFLCTRDSYPLVV
jgi:hypothetical protein